MSSKRNIINKQNYCFVPGETERRVRHHNHATETFHIEEEKRENSMRQYEYEHELRLRGTF